MRRRFRQSIVWGFLCCFTFLCAGPAILIPLVISLIVTAASIGIGLLINALTPRQSYDRNQITSVPLQGSEYGAVIPRIWGNRRLAGNVIWAASSFTDHINVTGGGTPGGGKGGPKQPQYKDHTYSISFASMFCVGPIKAGGGLINLYADTRLIFSSSEYGLPVHQQTITTPDVAFTVYYGYEDGTDGYASQDINSEMQADIDGRLGSGMTSAQRGEVYIFFHEFMITPYGNRIPSITAEWDEGTHDLGTIVSDLYLSVGLEAAHIDTSEITGTVIPGAALDTTSNTVRACLEGLMNAYSFELPEVNGKVTAKLLAADTTFSIPFDDLAAHAVSESRPIPIESTRVKETDLPKTVSISYLAPSRDFQGGSQSFTDLSLRTSNITQYSVNLALDDNQALQVAQIRQQEAILGRDQYVFAVPYKYATIAPADKGFIHDETGLAIQVKITSVEGMVPGALKMQAVRYDRSVYTQVAQADPGEFQARNSGSFAVGTGPTGGGGGGGGPDPDDGSPGWKVQPFNTGKFMPAIAHTTDDTLIGGTYAYMPQAGRLLVETVSGSGDYNTFAEFPQAAISGLTVAALGTVTDPNVFDNVNTVTIQMDNDNALTSVDPSDLILDDSVNKLLFANGEYVQFATATLVDDLTLVPRGLGEPVMYQVSTLLRGRHGSDYAVGTHTANEKVALVDNGLVYVTHEDRLLGSSLNAKFVPYGSLESQAPVVTMDLEGVTQKPLSAVNVYGTRDGSSNLTVNWTRRSRNPSSFRTRTDIPIAEESEEYQVDIVGNALIQTPPYVSAVTLTNFTGCRYSTAADSAMFPPYFNSVVKTAGAGWGNAGAVGVRTFDVLFDALDIGVGCTGVQLGLTGKQIAIGFTSGSTVTNYTDMDYCIVVTYGAIGNSVSIYESGSLITTSITDADSGVGIRISNGIIYYSSAALEAGFVGAGAIYSHAITPTLPLRVGVALNDSASIIRNIYADYFKVRTIPITSASATYSAADQTTDFGSAQASLDLDIYQISSTKHRGFPARATI